MVSGAPSLASKLSNARNQMLVAILVTAMILHSIYMTHLVLTATAEKPVSLPLPQAPSVPSVKSAPIQHTADSSDSMPDVFIYRRTKKTGSSSMLEALMEVLEAKGYVPLYDIPERMPHIVRAESLKPNPRRILVAQHNSVTRYHTPGRKTVIADTIYDGFRQVTSYCRFVGSVTNCGADMARCIGNKNMLNQVYYRWGGSTHEDSSNYIDLPLSAAHPALSTTVLRYVFPDVTLDVKKRNVAGSACEETKELRAAYDRNLPELEKQVDTLRKRMLSMAGYPTRADKGANATTAEMMDAAEERERGKYKLGTHEETKEVSDKHKELKWGNPNWRRSKSGALVIANEE